MKRKVYPVLLALTAAAGLAAAEPAKVERLPVIDRAIETHGGEIYRASEARLALCSKSGCSRIVARIDGDEFDLRVSGASRGAERTVRATNESVELWIEGKPTPVEPGGERALRDWVMSRVYFAFLPYRLNDPGVFKQDLGQEAWGDRQLHRVKVTFSPGSSTDADDQYLYWLDPESGRVEQFAYSYSNNGGGLRFRRAHNHRRVGGILFFDQENLGVEGPGLSVDRITPQFVAEKMRQVSDIELKDIEVEPPKTGALARTSHRLSWRAGAVESW